MGYPTQELELNYPRPVYLEEEGIYFLCRLYRYGMQTDDVYEQITNDIAEFWFDLFSSSLDELQRKSRFHTLVGISEEEETKGKVGFFLYFL